MSYSLGWWRERSYLGKWNRKAPYALVVSISTPEESVDLYTPVAVQVGIKVPIAIKIENLSSSIQFSIFTTQRTTVGIKKCLFVFGDISKDIERNLFACVVVVVQIGVVCE